MSHHYPKQEYIDSGDLIARLTHNLAQVKKWSQEEAMNYIGERTGRSRDTVYRWQQGHSLPKPSMVKALAEIAYSEAELSREWGEKFLHATFYPESPTLLNELWGAKELRAIPYRLPHLEHTRLLGRQKEIKQLLSYLSPQKAAYLITVDGIGGVGKTALVLDVASQCLKASTGEIIQPDIPTFDAIIFVSAKQQYLTAEGILQSSQANRTLRKLYHEVTFTLERYDIRTSLTEEQPELVREILGRQRTLLIVDNLETMEDKQAILSFLYELPPSVKVVVTTREQRAMYSPIRLEELEEEAALELIEQQATEKGVMLSDEEIHMLYRRIGGIPAALVYAVGQRATGYSLETVLGNVPRADGDVARFCFQSAVEPLRGQEAHHALMAFALFPRMPLRAAVSSVAGLEHDPIAADEALSRLQRLSLIREFQGRFRMLSLTREYAMAELMAQPQFEEEAHERWLKWYQKFTRLYGGPDNGEWHVSYDHLDEEWENLLAIFDWCATNEQYDVMKSFWSTEEVGSVVDFAHLYGYWDDRLVWLNWLLMAAEGRGDWLTMLDAIASIANTLAIMDRYAEAEELFKRGQRLNSYASVEVQVRLLINHAYLYIFMNRFEESRQLLDQARALTPQLPEPLRTRTSINIDYDYAAILYWSGDLAAARAAFSGAMERANDTRWQSLANYAQNYLADIAISQGEYAEAELLLEPGLAMAQRNKDRRRINSYMRSFAQLCQKQRRWEEALDWAQQAREGFEHLGVRHEVEKMDKLIQDVSAKLECKKERQLP